VIAPASMTGRAPKRAKSTPTSGPENPITIANRAAPDEIWVMVQPNSAWSDSMKTGKTYSPPPPVKKRITPSAPTRRQPKKVPSARSAVAFTGPLSCQLCALRAPGVALAAAS
jgi:hypothetical protein